MLNLSNKQKLLLLQVSLSFAAVCVTGSAGAANLSMSVNTTWGSGALANSSSVANASSGDNVDIGTIATAALTITNNGTATNGGGLNAFNVGSITNTGGVSGTSSAASVAVVTGSTNNLTTTISSVNISGDFSVSNQNAHNASVSTTISNELSSTTLTITNNEVETTNKAITTTVAGNLTVTGAATLTAGTLASNTANLTLTGATVSAGSFVLTESNSGTTSLTFNRTSAQAVSGAITNTSGKGTVAVNGAGGNATFSSNVGTSSAAKLLAFNVSGQGGGATTATVNADLNATTITLDDNSGTNTATLALSGSAAQTVSGSIVGGSSGEGIVTVNNATGVTFANSIGSVGLRSFTVASGKVATLGSSATALSAATVTNSGTLTVSAGTTLTSGTAFYNNGNLVLNDKLTTSGTITTFDLANTGASTITMGASSYTGDVMINAASVTTVAATNTVTVVPYSNMLSGSVTVVRAGTTAPLASQFTATGTNLMDYVFARANSNMDVTMTPTAKSADTLVSSLGITPVEAQVVAPLLSVANGNSTVTSAINSAATSTVGAKAIAVQSNPDTSGALANNIAQNTGVVLNTVSERLNISRNNAIPTVSQIKSAGLSAGNEPNRTGIWVKPYVYMGDQKEIDGVAGYKNKTYGALLGIDRLLTDRLRLGVSTGYSNANIHGGGLGQNDTDVTGYQASLYGDYTTEKYFIDGIVGYGTNEINTSRRITFGGLNQVALGEYNAQQYFARLEAGRPFHLAEHHVLTPTAGFDYSHLESDPYTETGADVLNLRVTPDSVNVGLVTVGMRYQHTNVLQKAAIHQVVRLGAGYDVIDDNGIATTKFASGTIDFRSTAPDISPLEGHAGLGLGYASADDVAHVTLDYDAELREKFVGHSIRLEWRYNF